MIFKAESFTADSMIRRYQVHEDVWSSFIGEMLYCCYDEGNGGGILQNKLILYNGKVWQGKSLVNQLFSSFWRKKVWRINRLAIRLLVVHNNLDGFSLAKHGRFAKLSHYMIF